MNNKIILVTKTLRRDPWPAAQSRQFQRTVVCIHHPKVFSQ